MQKIFLSLSVVWVCLALVIGIVVVLKGRPNSNSDGEKITKSFVIPSSKTDSPEKLRTIVHVNGDELQASVKVK